MSLRFSLMFLPFLIALVRSSASIGNDREKFSFMIFTKTVIESKATHKQIMSSVFCDNCSCEGKDCIRRWFPSAHFSSSHSTGPLNCFNVARMDFFADCGS